MVPPKLAPHHTHLICVNYCSDYHTSETAMDLDELAGLVNYYLDYGTSETLDPARSCEGPVNYCLVCGTSETRLW